MKNGKKIYDGFVARKAEPREAPKVYSFYKDNDRRGSVYLRHEELVTELVERGLVNTVWKDDILFAGSTIIPLAEGREISCFVRDNGAVDRGTVAEFSGLFNAARELLIDKDGDYPRNFLLHLLAALPMLDAFRLNGREMTADFVVANVQTRKQLFYVRDGLTQNPLSPHRWKEARPADGLLRADGETTSDPNANNDKLYYQAMLPNVPKVAGYVAQAGRAGKLTNIYGDTMNIDMNSLPLKDFEIIAGEDSFFKQARLRHTSWREARRIFPLSLSNDMVVHDVERIVKNGARNDNNGGGPLHPTKRAAAGSSAGIINPGAKTVPAQS